MPWATARGTGLFRGPFHSRPDLKKVVTASVSTSVTLLSRRRALSIPVAKTNRLSCSMNIIDDLHKEVQIKTFPPQRIVSVVPSLTELLYDLGLSEQIVGITKFCIFPELIFRTKPRIGGTKTLHLEKIDALQPDLILANKEENDKSSIEELSSRFPTYVSDIKTFEDALEKIRIIGEITDTQETSLQLLNDIQQNFSRLPEQTHKPKVAYMIWKSPMMVAGGDTYISDMLSKAGFENGFEHLSRYPEIGEKELQNAGIEYIFLSSEPFPFKSSHIADFKQILPSAQATLVDGTMFSWYGSRLSLAPTYFIHLRKELNI